jgi:hypothetical protein
MTDFEFRRSLRELAEPRLPGNDLWPGIAARIAAESAAPAARPRARRSWIPLAAAASLLCAVAAGALMLAAQRQAPAPQALVQAARPAVPSRVSPGEAHDYPGAPAGDPRLVGAAVVLDAAQAELQQAIEQRPDAVFLVSLLNRTNARRMKLDHFGASAG